MANPAALRRHVVAQLESRLGRPVSLLVHPLIEGNPG
jgi:hypothetical protein